MLRTAAAPAAAPEALELEVTSPGMSTKKSLPRRHGSIHFGRERGHYMRSVLVPASLLLLALLGTLIYFGYFRLPDGSHGSFSPMKLGKGGSLVSSGGGGGRSKVSNEDDDEDEHEDGDDDDAHKKGHGKADEDDDDDDDDDKEDDKDDDKDDDDDDDKDKGDTEAKGEWKTVAIKLDDSLTVDVHYYETPAVRDEDDDEDEETKGEGEDGGEKGGEEEEKEDEEAEREIAEEEGDVKRRRLRRKLLDDEDDAEEAEGEEEGEKGEEKSDDAKEGEGEGDGGEGGDESGEKSDEASEEKSEEAEKEAEKGSGSGDEEGGGEEKEAEKKAEVQASDFKEPEEHEGEEVGQKGKTGEGGDDDEDDDDDDDESRSGDDDDGEKDTKKVAKGSEPTVVLLHGAAFQAQTWIDLGTTRYLSKHEIRSIAVDLPGGKGRTTAVLSSAQHFETFLQKLWSALNISTPAILVSPSRSGLFSLPFVASQCGLAAAAASSPAAESARLLSGFVPIAPVGVEKYSPQLEGCKVNALVLHGEEDQPARGERLAKLFTTSKLVIFRKAGHACYMQKPKLFNHVLKHFVEKVSKQAQEVPK